MAAATLADRLDGMLRSIERVERRIQGKSFDDYLAEQDARDTVELHLRISEGSRHIPDAVKQRAPEIPWRKVANLGNVIRHDYLAIDHAEIWAIVKSDVPNLKQALLRFLDEPGA